MDAPVEHRPAVEDGGEAPSASLLLIVYVVAFITGAIVMSFEMLGSRYLGPFFGSGIFTWASLISTVLAALCVGYFLGGAIADRHPSVIVLAGIVAVGSIYLVVLPTFAQPVLQFFVWSIDDIKLGSLLSALAIMFFPVALLGTYSPFAIRLLLPSRANSGLVSGTVYGVSTAGSILGTLGTTFYLIPLIGSRAITFTLGISGLVASALLLAGSRAGGRARLGGLVVLVATSLLSMPASPLSAEELFDAQIRADLLKHKDGLIAHVETAYNDIFVGKVQTLLKMSFQWKGWYFYESAVNLADGDDLPMLYARVVGLAAIYPQDVKRVLVLGLGGGAVPLYLAHFLPDATVDSVEVDPGVIEAAKKYFGLRETERFHLIEGDGRLYLNRHSEKYDIIVLDAFSGSYIPFHMMTKEFYQLVREHLAPHGVVAINILPSVKLYDSNVRTLKLVFDNLDFFDSGNPTVEETNVIVFGRLDAASEEQQRQQAAAAQQHYKFHFDLAQLIAARRIATPKAANGEVFTDDFAPVNVYDALSRRYRRQQ
ncbi:MAG TPA: fused MFS/spermidine synthase [Xanthobacteraceae bacterium]|jgi:spermidine synthase|nr:fused MFS/spermidine synthase [Xanthobacteraceae bacterium]